MKKVKLMALGLMVMMIQSVGAVTLPSTSYSPYAVETSSNSDAGVVFSSGSMVTGSYIALEAGLPTGMQDAFDACVTSYPTPGAVDRMQCCQNVSINCIKACAKGDTECQTACGEANKDCISAGSLPLDGGLSILLALAIGSGAVRVFKRKK